MADDTVRFIQFIVLAVASVGCLLFAAYNVAAWLDRDGDDPR